MASAAAAARARIAQLDIEIEKLRQLMDPLLAEREKYQQALDDYKYPILTLPAEITSEIFFQYLPSYPERPSIVGTQSPSFLLRICRRWRDVAVTTPALWSTFKMLLDAHSLDHVQQRHLLDVWLQRSANCPLSIEIECSEELVYDDGENGISVIIGFVESLLCHATRWQDMDIGLPCEGLRRIAGSMPLLRSVTIGPSDGTEHIQTPLVLFTEAPALKNVALCGHFNPFSITLPWSQMTTLIADSLYADEAVEILRHATALESCTLDMYNIDMPLAIASSIPVLPVRSLKLGWYGDDTDLMPQLFFAALNLPLLETLSVDEAFLGTDPIAALSAISPHRYPQQIEIFRARTPRENYAGAFPLASVSVHALSVYIIGHHA